MGSKQPPYCPLEAISILENGGSASDIVRAGIRNKVGEPVAMRGAYRWAKHYRDFLAKRIPVLEVGDGQFWRNGDGYYEAGLTAKEVKPKPVERIPPRAGRRVTAPPVFLRSAVFDIECMKLYGAGDVPGHMICCCVLPLDTDEVTTHTLRFEDQRDDRRLLEEVIECLSGFQILIGHNIARFDLNWLYTRAVFYGLPPLPTWFYYDTYSAAQRLALNVRKSMAELGDFLRLNNGNMAKTAIHTTSWGDIDSPERTVFETAITNVIDHCQRDVRLNRAIFNELWKYDVGKKFGKTKW